MLRSSQFQETSTIYNGLRTIVYRAVRRSDRQPVIVKVLRDPHPDFNALVQFRNQFAIARNLDSEYVVRPLSLEREGNGYALVMPDAGAVSLSEYWSRLYGEPKPDGEAPTAGENPPQKIERFLRTAIQLACALHELGLARVVHKDIKPANILIDPETGQVKLIDFSIASLLPKEQQQPVSPNGLEGTLAYIAPEQTGRMNRGIDYRTDFYSLGVTLYELLTGQLPFTTSDPLELLHCHIAQNPAPPADLEDERGQAYSAILSAIVMKLMAKNAENRYQSALGLKHDLEQCLASLENTGAIAAFELGKRDICDRFTIPDKLYGRERDVQTLLDAFERVSQGSREMLLVAGFSGIGKTAVINEVHKPIVKKQGYFIKGKFDQFNRNIPFSAFVQAFRNLMAQLLGEPEQVLAGWKKKIIQAVGKNGQVLIEVIPELEQIIGPQTPADELSSAAAQNRFNLLFQRFIALFTTAKHPLVIFLDDLQWADSASLKLVQVLLEKQKRCHLLLLGAYRDNEVFPAHPLMVTVQELQQKEFSVKTITVTPLSEDHINQMVADTLNCPPDIAAPLTQVIYQRTQGNPFFSIRFLKSLYKENSISFNRDLSYWECDLTQVREVAITDNVLEFMASQLQKLPPATQHILKLAACIGHEFDLSTVSIVGEISIQEAALSVWPALEEQVLFPINEVYKFFQTADYTTNLPEDIAVSYRFLHDRIQQAAYSLIPAAERQEIHLKIGRLLLKDISNKKIKLDENAIFQIANQLNLGVGSIVDVDERQELAGLNFLAGKKALQETAYSAAAEYCSQARNLLLENAWKNNYKFTLELYELSTESEYLAGNSSGSETLKDIVLAETDRPLDRARVYEVWIQVLIAKNQFLKAISVGLGFLANLGIQLPQQPAEEEVERVIGNLLEQFPLEQISNLRELQNMVDPQQIVVMRILSGLLNAAYLANPDLLPLIVAKQVEISVTYGNTDVSPSAYANYGLILCGVVNEIEAGCCFGKLALDLFNCAIESKQFYAKTAEIVGLSIQHWQGAIAETLDLLLDGYKVGLETGDFESASFAAYDYCAHSFVAGKNLISLEQELQNYSSVIGEFQQTMVFHLNELHRQTILNLTAKQTRKEPTLLQGTAYDETAMLAQHQHDSDFSSLALLYIDKLFLAYLFGEYRQAVVAGDEAENYLEGIPAQVFVPLFHFYDALSWLSLYPGLEEAEKKRTIARIKAHYKKIATWAEHAPMNYAHKRDLLQAEQHRVAGDKLAAIEHYDRAIAGARANQYIQEEAIANERFALFYLDWGRSREAAAYMQEAHTCYVQWGARAKVERLEADYPELLAPILRQQRLESETIARLTDYTQTLTTTFQRDTQSHIGLSDTLDLAAILQASQVLSSSIELDKLLKDIVEIILANAGAKRIVLLTPNDDRQWHVRARAEQGENGEILAEMVTMPISPNRLPIRLIQYVKNTQTPVLIHEAETEIPGIVSGYLLNRQPQSVLCLPLIYQSNLVAVVYLEHPTTKNLFTSYRQKILEFLCAQAAVALQNAYLYEKEQKESTALKLSETRFKTMFDNAADAVFILSKTGFISANQACVTLFGYNDPSDFNELCPDQVSPERQPDGQPSADKSNAMMQLAYEKGCHKFEWLHEKADGTPFWTEVMLTPIPYVDSVGSNIDCLHAIVRDISDRKQTETEQQRILAILENAPDIVSTADLDGNILYRNKAFKQFLPEPVTTDDTDKIKDFHPDWALDIIQNEAIPAAIQTGMWEGETALLDSDGQEIPTSQLILAHWEQGQLAYLSTIIRDISARKKLEREQAELYELLSLKSSAIEESDAGIAILEDGKYTYLNKSHLSLLGYESQDLIGESWENIYDSDEVQRFQQDVFPTLMQHGRWLGEATARRKDGSYFPQEVSLCALDENQLIYICRDISDRKQAEDAILQKSQDLEKTLDELQKAQLQIVQSEKMSALGNLVAGVAHEINNPVGFLKGNIQPAQEYIEDLFALIQIYQDKIENPSLEIEGEIEEFDLEFIREDLPNLIKSMSVGIERIQNISNGLRTFSRKDRDKKTAFNIHEGIDSTLLILKHRTKANESRPSIQVIKSYSDLPEVLCFPGQLNQVFMNIFANAIDAFDEVNACKTYREIEESPNKLEIQTSVTDGGIRIQMRDNGCGMKPETVNKIFEQGFTTKEVGKGTGLGLAIAHQIVTQKHGGTLTCVSKLGQGTIFTLALPV